MRKVLSGSCMAALLCVSATAFAQTTGQNPTGSSGQAGSQTMRQPATGDRAQTEQQVTLVGCIQREAEYRQAVGSGKGGAAGSGLGIGNEFVLINASNKSSSGSPTAMSGSSTPGSATSPAATAGTSGTTPPETGATTGAAPGTTSRTPDSASSPMTMASGGTAYSLTGDREKDLEQHVGQRVEIVGTLEDGASSPGSTTGSATGSASGSTSSASPRAGDLKEVKIVSFKAVGSCSAQ